MAHTWQVLLVFRLLWEGPCTADGLPRTILRLWLQLDQFPVLLTKMQAEGLIPLLSLPVPFVPWLPTMALWLLPCWSMKMGAPPSDATASTSSRQPCLWEDRAQPGAPATSSCHISACSPGILVPTGAACLTGTNCFQHNRAREKPSTYKSPAQIPSGDLGCPQSHTLTGGTACPAPPVAAAPPRRTRHG